MPRPSCQCSLDSMLYDSVESVHHRLDACSWLIPNFITALGILLIPLLFVSLQYRMLGLVALILSLRLWLDFADGELARNCSAGSKLGGYLDSLSDLMGHSLLAAGIICAYARMKKPRQLVVTWVITAGVMIIGASLIEAMHPGSSTSHEGGLVFDIVQEQSVFLMLCAFAIWLAGVAYAREPC